MRTDPVENTAKYKAVIDEVERIIEEEMGDQSGYMGYCHMYWPRKKKLLEERGVSWQTPQELNPFTMFD